MSKRYPWTSFYWDDWTTATAHLSHLEYSIYHRLLAHYYRSQKPLLANATILPRLCCAFGTEELQALQSVLGQFFDLRTDGYHNKRADEEIEKSVSISKERAQVGRKGGLAKARNLLQQNSTHPHPHSRTPLTPLSGGLTDRQHKRVTAELQKIGQASIGAEIDDRTALETACTRAGVPFEKAAPIFLHTGVA